VFASGGRTELSRNIGSVVMDTDQVEDIQVAARGGQDTIHIRDLAGTGTTSVGVDLAGVPGSGQGDGAVDVIDISGTDGNDAIRLFIEDGALVVDGLAERIVIRGFDANDQIVIQGLGGDDVIDASAIANGGPQLVLSGGEGDDLLVGSGMDDTLIGGNGDDVLNGLDGIDSLDGGPGANLLIQ
jgi:Ca2+-binding RTX toxin-like protein